jgi:adenylate cyclase
LSEPLRIGLGAHLGTAIVGEMGYGRAVGVTAIGDAVNIASRLETLTKEFKAELVVSEAVVLAAGTDLEPFARHEIEIRGRTATLPVRVVPRLADLP